MHRYILCDKELFLRKDGKEISQEDFDFFENQGLCDQLIEEDQFEIQALILKTADVNICTYEHMFMREYFATHTEEESFYLFRAKALAEWNKDCKFCCSCGSELENHPTLTAKQCPSCGKVTFPRISPCIIVVVKKEGKVLLARHTYRNQDIYACIAGFMEAGESAESAVHREVFEETGIKIKNLVYRGSQSWPFPDQLMLGFTAEWESGELKLQESEIADAQWFDPENCPASPKPGSIAYRLIHGLY